MFRGRRVLRGARQRITILHWMRALSLFCVTIHKWWSQLQKRFVNALAAVDMTCDVFCEWRTSSFVHNDNRHRLHAYPPEHCMHDRCWHFFFSKFEMTPFGCGCRSENGLLRGMLHIMHCILSDAQKCNALHGSSLHSLGDSKGNCRFWIMCGVSSRKFQSMATTTIFCFTYSIDVTSLTSYNSQI